MSSGFTTCETEPQLFPDDPFFPFCGSDSTIDEILRSISEDNHNPENSFDSQIQSISLPTNEASSESFNGAPDQFLPHSYSEESLLDRYFLQRSHSSGCFSEKQSNALFHGFLNSPDFKKQSTGCSSPVVSQFCGHMRRVYSTGDLQSPLTMAEGSIMGEGSFKVGRYSAEQRKERILKYRAKRTQRNFNKTIKYACRKTLADSRPRIRGRFARNDETADGYKAASSTTIDDDDDNDFWNGLHEEGYRATMAGATFMATYGQARFQFYTY